MSIWTQKFLVWTQKFQVTTPKFPLFTISSWSYVPSDDGTPESLIAQLHLQGQEQYKYEQTKQPQQPKQQF